MKPRMVPPEDLPDFPSWEKATWRDVSGREHRRYDVRPAQQGVGFVIVDTNNNADTAESRPFPTEADARDWMRKNRAP